VAALPISCRSPYTTLPGCPGRTQGWIRRCQAIWLSKMQKRYRHLGYISKEEKHSVSADSLLKLRFEQLTMNQLEEGQLCNCKLKNFQGYISLLNEPANIFQPSVKVGMRRNVILFFADWKSFFYFCLLWIMPSMLLNKYPHLCQSPHKKW